MDWEAQYLQHMRDLVNHGERRMNRTGVYTLSLFAPDPIRVDLTEAFPAPLTKKLAWHSVRTELLWMMRGSTNISYLNAHGVHIWDDWADDNGDLGPTYGAQWRGFNDPNAKLNGTTLSTGVDQLRNLIDELRENPDSRRHVVSLWNPTALGMQALPPCPVLFQVNVREGCYLDMHVYQRSADWFLGVPFDIAGYATMTHLLAMFTGYRAGQLIFSYGDTHLYANQLPAANQQILRVLHWDVDYPRLVIAMRPEVTSDLDIWLALTDPEDLQLVDYHPQSFIKAPIAV